jgi:hypothetical protein
VLRWPVVWVVLGAESPHVPKLDSIRDVRDAAVVPRLEEVCTGFSDGLAELAKPLWRGVDAVHVGARPMFA